MNNETTRDNQPHSVDLHIEELVLNGFTPADGYAIGESLERELTHLIAEQGVTAAMSGSTDITGIDSVKAEIQPNSTADVTGTKLGNVIYGLQLPKTQ